MSEYSEVDWSEPPAASLGEMQDGWLGFLDTLKDELGGRRWAFLKDTEPVSYDGRVLVIKAPSDFHTKSLNEDESIAPIIVEGVRTHFGADPLEVRFGAAVTPIRPDVSVDPPEPEPEPEPDPEPDQEPEPEPEPPPKRERPSDDEREAKEIARRLRWYRVDDRAKSLIAEERSVAIVESLRERALPWLPTDEFLATVEPMEYRIEPLMMVGGRVLFSGAAKAGKSTLTLSLCNSLLTGNPFLSKFPVKPIEGSLLYVNLEMPDPLLGEWLDWHVDESVRPRFQVWNAIAQAALLDTRYEAGLEFLAERVVENDTRILVIDPITMAYSALGISANNNDEVAPWLNGLNVLKDRTGGKLEIILIHHFGHGMDRGRGASVQLGWPDHLWDYLVRDERRFLRTRGRSGFMEPSEVKMDPVYGTVSMDDEPMTAAGPTSMGRAGLLVEIQIALADSIDGLSQREITDYVAARASDVRAVLKDAVESGLISMTKEGRMHVYRWVG